MNKKMISIVLFVLVGALMVSAFSWVAITGFNKSQRAGMGNLTSLNAAEVSAYRWEALAKYYASHPTLTSDLTLLNAEQSQPTVGMPWPGSTKSKFRNLQWLKMP